MEPITRSNRIVDQQQQDHKVNSVMFTKLGKKILKQAYKFKTLRKNSTSLSILLML